MYLFQNELEKISKFINGKLIKYVIYEMYGLS